MRLTRLARLSLPYVAVLPLLWVLSAFILYPTLNTVGLSLSREGVFSLSYHQEFFTYTPTLRAFRNTIVLGFASVIVAGVIGTALAIFINSFQFWGRQIVDILLLIPIMIPGVALTIVFMQLYGQSGMLTKTVEWVLGLDGPPWRFEGFWAILFIHGYTMYVFFYVNVSAALKRVDLSMVEAAASLGAGRLRTYATVILPLLTPSFVAASVLTFMAGIGSFAAPSLVGGYRVLSVQILLSKVNNFIEFAAVQGLMLSVISIVFLGLMRWVESKRDYALAKPGATLTPKVVTGFWPKVALYSTVVTIVALLALPMLTIVLLSFVKQGTWIVSIFPTEFGFDNYLRFFERRRTYQPFVNSLTMAGMAACMAVMVGAFASYVIVKTRLKIRWLVEVAVLLPWALPSSTVAINMIAAFNEPTPFTGSIILVGTYYILPLTYFTGILVLVVRSTNAALTQLHDSLEEASRSLVAAWSMTFRRITLPLVAPGLLAGGLLGFVLSIDEYTASALMYTIHNQPISVAMTNAMYDFNIGLSMTYGVLQILMTFTLIWAIKRFAGLADFRF